jgi:tRNA G18 (ribose-2'-O)-methylase SpoU
VRARCDVVARVPMTGPLESLNVSAALAVACFEVARQRGG